ncbi:transposon Tf2-6 polyprotein [Trichonephila inaurata madagascariensis]|uniref:Transposon Tf2-6 polyprotein n=1 Tax=Trichonephila inaurata madagascariensis TaxID=2747483 RepID=A0A8X6WZL3_9ARAC|nr:transposon Tf2-6 polyprotein [Trichonephila inaurata madagascariensis]
MAEVTAVKIPPYNFSDPQLCKPAAAIVRDLIITPDETDPYGAIKAQLIQRTGESSQQEIRKLLTGEELGDRKPSELLRTMNRRAASHNVPKELMLELFLQQLPTAVQTILASITPITVEKAAEVADRILEVSTQRFTFDKRHCFIQRKPYPPRD